MAVRVYIPTMLKPMILQTGCYSLSRLEVQVEIFSKPQVNNHTLTLCDAGNNGTESFDFNEAHGEITSLANSISFSPYTG